MSVYLELETRRKIYDLISKNPGLNFYKIVKMLNIRNSLAEYHLQFLVKNDLLVVVKESGYNKRYYIKDMLGAKDRKALAVLRQEIPLQIVLYLLKNPYSKHN